MAPKKDPKADAKATSVLLGRPGHHLKIGIVGVPNVGKSTIYNALCKQAAPAENFPFCTINENHARVSVPDERFDFLVEHFKPASRVQAHLEVTDIAGLVRGASENVGLGNAFLSHIRAVDGIFQCIRVFEDSDITHVEGNIDPIRDLEIIYDELILKDLATIEDRLQTYEKNARQHTKDKKFLKEFEVLRSLHKCLKEDHKHVRYGEWKASDADIIREQFLLTSKPSVYLVNMSERDYKRKRNKWLAKIKEWVDSKAGGATPVPEKIIPFCGPLEKIWSEMDDETREAEIKKEELPASQIPKIVKLGYECLNLIHFFTCGTDEVKCWTILRGTKAPQAAGTIHTDFEKGFVCAETMSFSDFKEYGSEAACKDSGKYRQQGKNYEVLDGDILYIKANTSGLTKGKKK